MRGPCGETSQGRKTFIRGGQLGPQPRQAGTIVPLLGYVIFIGLKWRNQGINLDLRLSY